MGFIYTKKMDLEKRYEENPNRFYKHEILDIYAHAKDPAIRIDALKLLLKFETDPNSLLILEEQD